MRVRILRAFSGNNSGSYVLVGSFRDASAIEGLATELRDVFAAHAKWLETVHAMRTESSPLHEYATAQGLRTEKDVGSDDDWPTYGGLPRVEATSAQLLVFVDYSVTFPRFLGELVYRRGGRVSVELNHSHEPVVLTHTIWLDGGWKDPAHAQHVIDAFRAEVEDGALDALYLDPNGKRERSAPPILASGFWPGNLELVHVPLDVAAGVRVVTELVKKYRLEMRFSLFETPVHAADPIRGYRALDHGVGEHQVVLWKPGAVIADTVRAVRSATGLTLADATEMVARAPVEVLLRVSERDALAAKDALVAVGADAEVLGPQHFRRK